MTLPKQESEVTSISKKRDGNKLQDFSQTMHNT